MSKALIRKRGERWCVWIEGQDWVMMCTVSDTWNEAVSWVFDEAIPALKAWGQV